AVAVVIARRRDVAGLPQVAVGPVRPARHAPGLLEVPGRRIPGAEVADAVAVVVSGNRNGPRDPPGVDRRAIVGPTAEEDMPGTVRGPKDREVRFAVA